MSTFDASSLPAGIDPGRESVIPCLVVDEHEVLSTLHLAHLLQLVPDPQQFEDKKLRPLLTSDPALADLAEQRETIQRYFTGAKKSNLPKYADYISERVRHKRHRGTPPICLGTTKRLKVVSLPNGQAGVAIQYGARLLAVDGETQRAAWTSVNEQVFHLIDAGIADEEILSTVKVPVEIHHGLTVEELQALFYDRNVLGAKVNVNEAIAKDQRDPATQICRSIMSMPLRKPNGELVPFGPLVMQQSRQVGRKSPQWITLSALRTLVVTTLLGRPGLQFGAKPISMPEGVDFNQLKSEVTSIVHTILERFAADFADKERTLIGAPAIMAGIGIAANRAVTAMPNTSGRAAISLDQLLAMLSDIKWDKEVVWDGIATRKTPKGVTTVAGPKEVGYAVADAIDGANAVTAAQIRGGRVAPPTPPASEQWSYESPVLSRG